MSVDIPPGQHVVPVVLGGDTAAYTLVRSFHELTGGRGVIVSEHETGPVRHSKVVRNVAFPGADDAAVLVPRLLALATELRDQNPTRRLLLLASADHLVHVITHHRAELEADYAIPYPSVELFERVTHKAEFRQVVAEAGLAHPRTVAHVVGRDAADRTDATTWDYPLMVKPDNATAWHQVSFAGQHKVHKVDSVTELHELLTTIEAAGYTDSLVLQQYIPGGDEQLRVVMTYSDDTGRTRLACCAAVVVEEHTPSALGNAAGLVSITDDILAEQAAHLLDTLGWTGWATFDVKVDPRDGTHYILEVNPRMGRSNYLITASGLNPYRYLLPWVDGEPLPLGPEVQQVEREVLYTLLPPPLLLRWVTQPERRRQVLRCLRRGRVVHPLVARFETDPRRWAYATAFMANQVRKFARYYPTALS